MRYGTRAQCMHSVHSVHSSWPMGASKRALHSQMELAELRAAQKAQATQLQRAYDPASLTGADCLIGWCEMGHSSHPAYCFCGLECAVAWALDLRGRCG
jgi:hypothetical protein